MLKGEKVNLRPFETGDAEYLNALRRDFEGIKTYVGNPFPSNECSQKEWIESMYPLGFPKNIYLVIEENLTNKFVGYTAARNINYVNSTAEIGTMLCSEGRGKGYYKEGQIIFYNYLFNQLNLQKLHSFALTDHQIALATVKKIGFVEEGCMKKHVFQDGQFKDVIIVSLFKDTFNEIHNIKL